MNQQSAGKLVFISVIMFLTGSIFLILQIGSLFFDTSRSAEVDSEVIILNKSEVFSDIRTIVIILLSFGGGVGMLRRKSFGWICSLPVLLLLVALSSAGWMFLFNTSFNSSYILVPLATALLIFAITTLLLKSTRLEFRIAQKEYVITLILTIVLALLYFFLQ